MVLDFSADDDFGEGFGHEDHAEGEDAADDDVDVEDWEIVVSKCRWTCHTIPGKRLTPSPSHVRVVRDPLSNRTAQGRAKVCAQDEECHGLSGVVPVTPQICNGARDVAQSGRSSGAAKKLKDNEHRQISGQCGSNVQDGVHQYASNIHPFSSTDICQGPEKCRTDGIANDKHGLAKCDDLCASSELFLDQELHRDVCCGCQGNEHLEGAIDSDDCPFLPEAPVDGVGIVVGVYKLEEGKGRISASVGAFDGGHIGRGRGSLFLLLLEGGWTMRASHAAQAVCSPW